VKFHFFFSSSKKEYLVPKIFVVVLKVVSSCSNIVIVKFVAVCMG
jgi:hypothetical protein